MRTLVATLALFGCGPSEQTDSSSDWDARFRAADGIQSADERDEAFAGLANLAGEAGDVDVAKRAIDKMGNVANRDRAARDAAISLAKAGQIEAARQIAERIQDNAIEDDTRKQITQAR